MKRKILSRVISGFVVLSRLLASAGAAFDSGFTYSYPVGEGLTYTRSEGKTASGLQKANILTYTPNSGVTPIIAYAGETLNKSTITNVSKYLVNQGKNVIGGSNADFFVMASGIPIGLVIDKGELVSSDAWQYAIGFKKDGSAVTGQPAMGIRVTGASGTVNVSYFNKTRTTAGAYLLDRKFGSSTQFKANGESIILERMDDTPVKVNGSVSMRVINKISGSGSFNIESNQMVLTKSNGAKVPSWVDFPIGEEVTLSVACNDPAWGEVEYAVGGKQLISNGNVATKGIDSGATPRARSAAGVTADGRVILYEIDGNLPSHSAGLTASELGKELAELGCVDAVCLDGGGSSAMLLRQPGESAPTLISSPSDGAERACANYVFFVGGSEPDGVTAHAVLTPEYRYLMPGASTLFTLKGADASFGPAPAPEGMVYTVESGAGTIEGGTYTASDKPGNAVIHGSNGTVEGAMGVCVTDAVDSIILTSGGNAVENISIPAEGVIDLNVEGYHQGERMASSDRAVKWSVSTGIGAVDENGVFTASDAMGQGALTCSIGAISKVINVNVSMGEAQEAALIADFEDGHKAVSSEGVELLTVKGQDETARGMGSLKAAYNASETSSGTISFPTSDAKGMGYVTLWARDGGAGTTLAAVFEGDGGSEITSPFDSVLGNEWKQYTATVPKGAKGFTGIRFMAGAIDSGNSALYLDQIVLSESHAVTNTDAPQFSLEKGELSVNADEPAVLTGAATIENGLYPARESGVEVKLDGKRISGAAEMDGARLTVKTGALAEGVHCAVIDVVDDAGNRTRKTATITSGSAGSAFADTGIHWSNGYATLLSETGIMKGEISDGAPYFRPDRNLKRMEFAVTMARVLGLDATYTGGLDFTDDKDIPSWARGAIYAVWRAGVMNGRKTESGVSFAPGAEMTRAEVMTVIGRCLPKGYSEAQLNYRDKGDIPSWALEGVSVCVSVGVVGGYQDNTLKPNGKITRGEIAKILALY